MKTKQQKVFTLMINVFFEGGGKNDDLSSEQAECAKNFENHWARLFYKNGLAAFFLM